MPERPSGAFSLLDGWEAETRKPEDRLHSTSHFFTPPYIPKQRWPPSESQCNPESHALIPSATMALLCVSDATQNQSHPLLFLHMGGGCVGVFCWICQRRPQEDGWVDASRPWRTMVYHEGPWSSLRVGELQLSSSLLTPFVVSSYALFSCNGVFLADRVHSPLHNTTVHRGLQINPTA